jgi:hypothetical protein
VEVIYKRTYASRTTVSLSRKAATPNKPIAKKEKQSDKSSVK